MVVLICFFARKKMLFRQLISIGFIVYAFYLAVIWQELTGCVGVPVIDVF